MKNLNEMMTLIWKECEDLLYKCLEESVKYFAETHSDETFYFLRLDWNGAALEIEDEIDLSFDTDSIDRDKMYWGDAGSWKYFDMIDQLREDNPFLNSLWEKYENHVKYVGMRKLDDFDLDELNERLKLNDFNEIQPDDWAPEELEEEWPYMCEDIMWSSSEEDTRSIFYKATHRLKNSDAIKLLNKTEDFQFIVSEYD